MERRFSKKKQTVFFALITLITLSIFLILAEMIIKYRKHSIQKSNRLDAAFMQHDKKLGWRLTPNWKGRHRHYDYDVIYTTNAYGFRGDFRLQGRESGPRYAFVGDSFTFCLGVNDDQTFIELLNRREARGRTYLNFGIPGYSTDQEYLLIRDRVFDFSPNILFLVLYLGNDLLDNQLSYPLQANNAKPFFTLTPKGLRLQNTPVPLKTKPRRQAHRDLETFMFLQDDVRKNLLWRLVMRFELFRFLRIRFFFQSPDLSQEFDHRFDPALRLFSAILDNIRNECSQRGVDLVLILLPGRSFIERSGSPSAQLQEHFRLRILTTCHSMNCRVIDVAKQLLDRFRNQPGKWFYPNEGHFNEEGQKLIAEILTPSIQEVQMTRQ